MALKIINPGYVDSTETFIAANKAAVQAWVNALPNTKRVADFAEIRAALPALASKLTDGMLAEILVRVGVLVVDE